MLGAMGCFQYSWKTQKASLWASQCCLACLSEAVRHYLWRLSKGISGMTAGHTVWPLQGIHQV